MQADASSAVAPAQRKLLRKAAGQRWSRQLWACLVHSLVLVLVLEAIGLIELNHQLRRVSTITGIIWFMHRWSHSSTASPASSCSLALNIQPLWRCRCHRDLTRCCAPLKSVCLSMFQIFKAGDLH